MIVAFMSHSDCREPRQGWRAAWVGSARGLGCRRRRRASRQPGLVQLGAWEGERPRQRRRAQRQRQRHRRWRQRKCQWQRWLSRGQGWQRQWQRWRRGRQQWRLQWQWRQQRRRRLGERFSARTTTSVCSCQPSASSCLNVQHLHAMTWDSRLELPVVSRSCRVGLVVP